MIPSELPPGIPSVVRVGPFDIDVVPLTMGQAAEKQAFGEFAIPSQEIRIDPNIPPIKFVDTFYHELFHAFYWAYGVEDGDKEERTVGFLTTALVDFTRNNPQLAARLVEIVNRNSFD